VGRTIGRVGAVAVGVFAAMTALVPVSGAVSGAAPDTGTPQASVVTLRDQLAGVPVSEQPARATADQQAVLADLRGPTPTGVQHLSLGNILLADLTPAQRGALAADPRVAAVGVDEQLTPNPVAGKASSTRSPQLKATMATPAQVPASVCTGTQQQPQLEPEALGIMNVRSDDPAVPTAARLGFDGSGVKVGIITTAIDPDNPNWRRADNSNAVADYTSFNPTGYVTHAAEDGEGYGDVSSVGAQGTVAQDLAQYVDPSSAVLPGGHCWIRIEGVAPGADMVVTDVLDHNGPAIFLGAAAQGIDYAVNVQHVDVLSESFGGFSIPSPSLRTAVEAANAAAIARGVTVVVSSGDEGDDSTIGSPAGVPGVLTVGATLTGRIGEQVNQLGQTLLSNGSWHSDATAFFSSSGFTQEGSTLDVVAPGYSGWASCTGIASPEDSCKNPAGEPSDVFRFGGTSESAPFTAGIAALVIQAYRAAHGGQSPTPDLVRHIITGTATDLGMPADQQGNGMVDALAAVQAASTIAGGTGTGGGTETLVPGASQAFVTGAGGPVDLSLTAVNTGSSAVPAGTATLTRDVVGSSTGVDVAITADDPQLVDGSTGITMAYRRYPITVPAGATWMQLDLQALFSTTQQPSRSALLVLDPDGATAAVTTSGSGMGTQGSVPHPVAGTWTVVVEGSPTNPFTGHLTASFGRRVTLGTAAVGAAAPGGSTTIAMTVDQPADSGDTAATLRYGSLTVPVMLRRLLDLDSGSAAVDGVLRPGDGRADSETATYDMDVPAGTPALTAGVVLDPAAAAEISTYLVDPHNTVQSVGSNVVGTEGVRAATSQTVADPAPGRWRLVVTFASERQLSQTGRPVPFRATVSTAAVGGAATGLTGGTVTAGGTRTVTLPIRNPGVVPLAVTLDPRRSGTTRVTLPTSGTLKLPYDGNSMDFTVPRFSTSLQVDGTVTTPATMMTATGAGLTLLGDPGAPLSLGVDAADLDASGYLVQFGAPGPVTATRPPTGSATVAASVVTAPFDPAVTTADG
jgi:hypothetical protein